MTKEEALRKTLVLTCRACGNKHEAHPDGAIREPHGDAWFGVVDAPGPCGQCNAESWRYER